MISVIKKEDLRKMKDKEGLFCKAVAVSQRNGWTG